MSRLYAHQIMFISYALGGPDTYEGPDLREAHHNLVKKYGLNEGHFNIVAEHLLGALIELRVEPNIRGQIMEIVASTKDAVLGTA